jgi:ketosteroid isomerase-like protein
MSGEELIQLVLSTFEAERQNNVEAALELLTDDYKMTDMMLANDGKTLFPAISAQSARDMIGQVYQIKERTYRFVNTGVDVEKGIVFIEFVERYPDPDTGQHYCTPQMAVCEVVGGKIRRTRHYMDPRTAFIEEVPIALEKALS